MQRWPSRIAQDLFQRVDCSTLATFRILFGLLLVWETVRFWPRIQTVYLASEYAFRYPFFGFLPTPSEAVFYAIFSAMGIAAFFLALGLWYRAAAVVLSLTYTYIFLLEQTSYNNHYYLTAQLCFFFVVTAAHADFSVDAWRELTPESDRTIPVWHLLLFKLQLILVYFFGGVAKINWDWLDGEPMRNMLKKRAADFPIAGMLEQEWCVYFFAYGGLVFDLSIGFLLLFKRTRLLAIVLVCFFHLTNNWLFDIGVFPWLGIAATVMFLERETPRRVLRLIHRGRRVDADTTQQVSVQGQPTQRGRGWISRRMVCWLFLAYFLVQILLPFRHTLYRGKVAWTEEGHNFSWRMKLRSKDGMYRFLVHDPISGRTEQFPDGDYLTDRQRIGMSTRPHLLLQFAHFIRDEYMQRGMPNVEVYVESIAALNGRPFQQLVNSKSNLAKIRPSLWRHGQWIAPLQDGMPIGNYPQTSEERVVMMRKALIRKPSGSGQ